MLGSSISNRLKSFDVYRKLPKDLTEPTMSGAMVSLVSTIIMGILFITEFNEFLKVQTVSEMFIDINRGGEKLLVNVDLEFPRFPCDIISLDAQDVMGSHHVNVGGNLLKRRMDASGKTFEDFHDSTTNVPDWGRLKEAFTKQEGCHLMGSIEVNKVPGNFHVSCHAYQHFLTEIVQHNNGQTIDLSHQINHISFGSDEDLKEIKKKFNRGVLNPLDGVKVIKSEAVRNGVMTQYYINVVPTTYQDMSGKELYVHQFTVNSNSLETGMLPAVYFRYDLSPVTVKYTLKKESFFHFLVQICAIIGGIFTVAGIIDSLIHKSVVHLLKKAQMGKLS